MEYCNVENGCIMCDHETCDGKDYEPKYKTVKEAQEAMDIKKVGRILKPCPVCGAAAKILEWSNGTQVDCSNWMGGGNTIGMHYVFIFAQTTDEAVERWNRRAGQSEPKS